MRLKEFLLSEDGSIMEYLVQIIIIGLGSAAILFGILAALRHQGGVIVERVRSLEF
ncbi:MAG: hypothetical protein ACPLTR_12385 [Thermacetogeniaceae bacterium]